MPISKSQQQTKDIAKNLAKKLQANLVCLYGEIGSGKTTFTKGFVEHYVQNTAQIKSPTYTYIRIYPGKIPIYHLDLYRVQEDDQLIIEELKELLETKNAIIIIEWAEKIAKYLPKKRTDIHFKYIDENSREINIS